MVQVCFKLPTFSQNHSSMQRSGNWPWNFLPSLQSKRIAPRKHRRQHWRLQRLYWMQHLARGDPLPSLTPSDWSLKFVVILNPSWVKPIGNGLKDVKYCSSRKNLIFMKWKIRWGLQNMSTLSKVMLSRWFGLVFRARGVHLGHISTWRTPVHGRKSWSIFESLTDCGSHWNLSFGCCAVMFTLHWNGLANVGIGSWLKSQTFWISMRW